MSFIVRRRSAPMAEVLGHDIGYTLWVRCDQCGKQMMAFGRKAVRRSEIAAELREELEAIVRAEGWGHTGGGGWLCERCAGGSASGSSTDSPDAEQNAAADGGS